MIAFLTQKQLKMPMVNFTFEDLQNLENNERFLQDRLALKSKTINAKPKKSTVDNLLNYSKVLSVRDSKNLKKVKMILN